MIRFTQGFTTAALLTATAIGLGACGDDGVASGAVQPQPTLMLAQSAKLGGSYLVDGAGRTLYLFAHDLPAGGGAPAQSGCLANPDPSKSCVAFWPIFHADPLVVSGVNAGDVGVITRPDGLQQTTYKGFPLYTYVGDTAAGDTNGDASTGGGPVAVWFAVREPAYTVMTLTNASGTTRLIDGAGRTLYRFAQDTVGANPTSACTGVAGDRTTCLGNWPVFAADPIIVPTGIDVTRFAKVTRADGLAQLAFDGQPLYYFADDKVPGDVLGLTFPPGLGFWFTVAPK